MLSILNKTELELFPYHEHVYKECTCNLYGYAAKQLLLQHPKNYDVITLFLLKFRILYDILELGQSVVDTKWFENFKGDGTDCVPFEIDLVNISKLDFLLKKMNKTLTGLPIHNDRYIYIRLVDYQIRRINYPKQNNPKIFEYYTMEKDMGKYYTYLPLISMKRNVHQLNIVLSILNNLVNSPLCLQDINFEQIERTAKELIDSTFLDGILTDNVYVKRDIKMLADIYAHPENIFYIIGLYN